MTINWFKYASPASFLPVARRLVPWFATGAALLASGSARFEGSYLRMSYNRPEAQVRQLEAVGFEDCRVFDLAGRELAPGPEAWDAPDHWLYYLCRRR